MYSSICLNGFLFSELFESKVLKGGRKESKVERSNFKEEAKDEGERGRSAEEEKSQRGRKVSEARGNFESKEI